MRSQWFRIQTLNPLFALSKNYFRVLNTAESLIMSAILWNRLYLVSLKTHELNIRLVIFHPRNDPTLQRCQQIYMAQTQGLILPFDFNDRNTWVNLPQSIATYRSIVQAPILLVGLYDNQTSSFEISGDEIGNLVSTYSLLYTPVNIDAEDQILDSYRFLYYSIMQYPLEFWWFESSLIKKHILEQRLDLEIIQNKLRQNIPLAEWEKYFQIFIGG